MKLPVNTLTLSPAAILYAINTGVALLVSFGLGLSPTVVGGISTAAAAVIALVMAVMVRPWHVGAITGAVVALLTACAAFGLKLSADQLGLLSAGLSIVLGLLTGLLVIPAAAAQRGTTAHALMLGPARVEVPARSTGL